MVSLTRNDEASGITFTFITGKSNDPLDPDFVPSLFLFSQKESNGSVKRYLRHRRRQDGQQTPLKLGSKQHCTTPEESQNVSMGEG